MRVGKNKVCPVCGKVCRPGGIGGHLRLKHGIVVKTMLKHVREVRDVSGDVSGEVSEVRDVSGEVSDERVQRPSDFVKKHDKIVKTHAEPAFKFPDVDGYVGPDPPFGVSAISDKGLKRYQEELKRLKDLEAKE